MSSREQADRCEVSGAPNIVLTCDEPTRERRFTIKFQEFSPNLWGHEFKSMQDYFIIGEWSELRWRLGDGKRVFMGVCVCWASLQWVGWVVMIAWLISDCAWMCLFISVMMTMIGRECFRVIRVENYMWFRWSMGGYSTLQTMTIRALP